MAAKNTSLTQALHQGSQGAAQIVTDGYRWREMGQFISNLARQSIQVSQPWKAAFWGKSIFS